MIGKRIFLPLIGLLLVMMTGFGFYCDKETVEENVPVRMETEACGSGVDFTPPDVPPTLEPC